MMRINVARKSCSQYDRGGGKDRLHHHEFLKLV